MSKAFGTDLTIAFPFAEIAVMEPEAAANVIFKDEITDSSNPGERRTQKIQEYRDKFANPYVAAERGWIDIILEPREVRSFVIKAFERLRTKQRVQPEKKHGTIPL